MKVFLDKDEHFLRKLICLQLPSWALSHPLQVQGLHARCGLCLCVLPYSVSNVIRYAGDMRKPPVCKAGFLYDLDTENVACVRFLGSIRDPEHWQLSQVLREQHSAAAMRVVPALLCHIWWRPILVSFLIKSLDGVLPLPALHGLSSA